VDYFDIDREADPYEILSSWLGPTPQDDCDGTRRIEVMEPLDPLFDYFGIVASPCYSCRRTPQPLAQIVR